MASLSAVKIESIINIGRKGSYPDGDGLYFDIPAKGNIRWLFRYQLNGKRKLMSLGVYHKKINTLAMARVKALEHRALITQGIDPVDNKRRIEEEAKQELVDRAVESKTKEMTFEVCATDYIESMQAEWSNAKHIQQWTNTLKTYVYPEIGAMPVADIETDDIKRCLDPIWLTKTETASRIRQRIESVMAYSIANKYRQHANPAIWKGLLDQFYPKPEKVKQKIRVAKGTDGHHPALPYEDMPAFMAKLVKIEGIAAKALRFLILTVPRTTELRLAEWDEFNLEKKEWNIPASRMKARKQHRVALSDAAVKIIEEMPRINKYVFAGWKYGTHLSDGGMVSVLRRMDRQDITVHGFRSTFRDYIGEETGFPHRLAEFALAHQLTDDAEKAYARGDLLKKRFVMMNAWADYVDSKTNNSNVISIKRKAQS